MSIRLATLQNETIISSTDQIDFLRIIEIFTLAQNWRSEHATASLSCKLNYLPIEFRHNFYTTVSSTHATFQFINSIQPTNYTHFVWRVQMTWLWPWPQHQIRRATAKSKSINNYLCFRFVTYFYTVMDTNLATLQQLFSFTTTTDARFARQILIVRPKRKIADRNMQLQVHHKNSTTYTSNFDTISTPQWAAVMLHFRL